MTPIRATNVLTGEVTVHRSVTDAALWAGINRAQIHRAMIAHKPFIGIVWEHTDPPAERSRKCTCCRLLLPPRAFPRRADNGRLRGKCTQCYKAYQAWYNERTQCAAKKRHRRKLKNSTLETAA